MSLWFWFAFPRWSGCWASFHVPVGHLCVFSGNMSIQVLFPFINQFFLLLSCMCSLCILDINSLSDMSFENIFSHSVCCPFILLVVSFTVQRFLVWCSPICFCFCFPCLRRQIQIIISKTDVKKHVAYTFF